MKTFLAALVVIGTMGMTVRAQAPESAETPAPPAMAVTNEPAATQAVTEVTASIPEWIGYVRVLKDEGGDVRAIRLVAGDKLIAVDLTEKGLALAKVPKTRKVAVKGALEDRDGRAWLVVTDFADAPESAVPGVPAIPDASTNAPAAP